MPEGEGVYCVTTRRSIDSEDGSMDRTAAVLDADGVSVDHLRLPADPHFALLRFRLLSRDAAGSPPDGA